MNAKLEIAKQEARMLSGAVLFFKAHPEVWSCDANVNILSYFILKELLEGDALASWEKAFAACSTQLASAPPPQVEVEQVKEDELWPHRFCRPIYTLSDVKRYPAGEYKALYFDRNKSGELTEKAKIFRALVQDILDRANAQANEDKFKEAK